MWREKFPYTQPIDHALARPVTYKRGKLSLPLFTTFTPYPFQHLYSPLKSQSSLHEWEVEEEKELAQGLEQGLV